MTTTLSKLPYGAVTMHIEFYKFRFYVCILKYTNYPMYGNINWGNMIMIHSKNTNNSQLSNLSISQFFLLSGTLLHCYLTY